MADFLIQRQLCWSLLPDGSDLSLEQAAPSVPVSHVVRSFASSRPSGVLHVTPCLGHLLRCLI